MANAHEQLASSKDKHNLKRLKDCRFGRSFDDLKQTGIASDAASLQVGQGRSDKVRNDIHDSNFVIWYGCPGEAQCATMSKCAILLQKRQKVMLHASDWLCGLANGAQEMELSCVQSQIQSLERREKHGTGPYRAVEIPACLTQEEISNRPLHLNLSRTHSSWVMQAMTMTGAVHQSRGEVGRRGGSRKEVAMKLQCTHPHACFQRQHHIHKLH